MRGQLRIALTADPEIPVPPETYGGIERVVDLLARGLSERGHAVTLVASPVSSCPVELAAWPGRTSTSIVDTIRNTVHLTRLALTGDFDLVHSFSRLAYLAPLLPSKLPKLMSYQRKISPRPVRIGRILGGRSLTFSAISREMVKDVEHLSDWRIVFNGVPTRRYTFRPTIAADAPLVFLGRVEEIKGPHLAIEVARKTGRKLIIAGNVPPEHRDWFDTHVAPRIDGDQVSYVGPVDDREKDALLGGAEALLMPILWEEPFGIVMAEALACGTPVLGLARGSVPEVVEDGVSGFVEETVEGLVDSVSRVRGIRREDCRRRAEELFSEDAVVEGYLHVYRRMLGFRSGETAA